MSSRRMKPKASISSRLQMRSMYRQGVDTYSIAKATGVSETSVRRHCADLLEPWDSDHVKLTHRDRQVLLDAWADRATRGRR